MKMPQFNNSEESESPPPPDCEGPTAPQLRVVWAELMVRIPPYALPVHVSTDPSTTSTSGGGSCIEISSADAASLDVLDKERVLVFPLGNMSSSSEDGEETEMTEILMLDTRQRRKRRRGLGAELTTNIGRVSGDVHGEEDCLDGVACMLPRTPIASVCSVGISNSDGVPNPRIRQGRQMGKQQGPVRVGEARFQPQSPLTLLFLQTDAAKELKKGVEEAEAPGGNNGSRQAPSTPDLSCPGTRATATASASPSGSIFSFARGGGGDSIISPSSRLPPSVEGKGPQRRTLPSEERKVAIIPLHQLSYLPRHLRTSLLEVASTIVLSTCGGTILPRVPKRSQGNRKLRQGIMRGIDEFQPSGEVLREMVVQSYQGRYIQPGDVLDVPFCGRTIQLAVEEVSSSKEEMDNPAASSCASGETMGPKDFYKGESSQFLTRLYEILCGLEGGCSVLYQIQAGTKIKFGAITPSSSETSTQNNVKNMAGISSARLVAGLDMAIQEIRSILLPSLSHPHMFAPVGGASRPPRGILLHGASGTGKSRLAAQVGQDLASAPNGWMGREIFVQTVSTHKIQSYASILGRAERELSRIFDRAERRASRGISTLLIMDDVHLICPQRGREFAGTASGGAKDMMASTLLALLDGIGSRGGKGHMRNAIASRGPGTVMLLAITSDPSYLDPALRRPGRIDCEIEIPIPDEVAKADILKFLLNGLGHGSGRGKVKTPPLSQQDLLDLSRLAKGFTGADCCLALKEAVRCAVSQCDQDVPTSSASDNLAITVTHEDVERAIRLTKPSTIRAVTVEVPRVPWSSVGGMEGVKTQLREAVELPLTHSHLFEGLAVPPPRGVLLYGPPGNSKTLMARAIATESSMNFLAVKGPELLSKWLGESERALASLFHRARMASPAVIFFDEIDSIAAKRGSGGGSGGRLLSQLLTELDGVGTQNLGGDEKDARKFRRVVVVGATNRPDLLDPALTRPGRIDRKIFVGLPDEASRREILKIGLKGKACEDDVDVLQLSKDELSGGFSGAELIAISRESALYALEDSGSSAKIGTRHLLHSLQSTKRQITPEMLAFYESYRIGTT